MKKYFIIYVFFFTTILFGCLSPQQIAQRVWYPNPSPYQYFYYQPHALKTTEEAISTIKLNVPNFFEWKGDEVLEVNIDKYGLIIKTRWVSHQTNYVVKPVTHSGFANNKISGYYSNTTYVGQYQTTTNSGISSFPLQFKRVDSITLFRVYDIKYNFEYGITIREKDNQYPLNLLVRNKATALDLINAIYTLASKAGAKVSKPGLGIIVGPLTNEQKLYIGNNDQTGVIVQSVYSDSPAEKYGFQINDIITKIDGQAVVKYADLINLINNRKKIKVTLIRLSGFDDMKNIYNHEVIQKDVLLK